MTENVTKIDQLFFAKKEASSNEFHKKYAEKNLSSDARILLGFFVNKKNFLKTIKLSFRANVLMTAIDFSLEQQLFDALTELEEKYILKYEVIQEGKTEKIKIILKSESKRRFSVLYHDHIDLIIDSDLNKNEVKLFLTLLKNQFQKVFQARTIQNIPDLMKKLKMKKSSFYLALKNLQEKGLVEKHHLQNNQYQYEILNPEDVWEDSADV